LQVSVSAAVRNLEVAGIMRIGLHVLHDEVGSMMR
jgi:hypothetical protein